MIKTLVRWQVLRYLKIKATFRKWLLVRLDNKGYARFTTPVRG